MIHLYYCISDSKTTDSPITYTFNKIQCTFWETFLPGQVPPSGHDHAVRGLRMARIGHCCQGDDCGQGRNHCSHRPRNHLRHLQCRLPHHHLPLCEYKNIIL